MYIFRAIQTHPHQNSVSGDKVGPVPVEQGSISLNRVGYRASPGSIEALKLNRALKKIQPHQSRLAPLPVERICWLGRTHIPPHQLLQHLVAHAVGLLRSE